MTHRQTYIPLLCLAYVILKWILRSQTVDCWADNRLRAVDSWQDRGQRAVEEIALESWHEIQLPAIFYFTFSITLCKSEGGTNLVMVMRQRGDKDWEQCLPEVPSNADKRGEANISDWRWKLQNWISPSALCHRTAVRSKCLTRGTKKPKSQEKAFEQALHLLNNGLEKNYWSVKDQFVFTSLKCDFKVNIFPKIFLLKDVKTKYLDWDSRSKSHLPVICLSWQQDCLRGNSTTSPVTQNKSFV